MVLRTHRLCSMCKNYISLQVLNHEAVCPERNVSCPFCHTEMSHKDYIKHIPVHADELLAIAPRLREIPESFQNYHTSFTMDYKCDHCHETSRNPATGGGRFRCLECPDYDLCGACFVKHCISPGLIHSTKHHFTLVNPASLVPASSSLSHCHEIILAQDSPVGSEAATANALFTAMFIRSLSKALPEVDGNEFECEDCKKKFKKYSVCWRREGDNSTLCPVCICKRVITGASAKMLGHVPVRPNGSNVFTTNNIMKTFGLFKDPNPVTM